MTWQKSTERDKAHGIVTVKFQEDREKNKIKNKISLKFSWKLSFLRKIKCKDLRKVFLLYKEKNSEKSRSSRIRRSA